jgi:hypothetical protein
MFVCKDSVNRNREGTRSACFAPDGHALPISIQLKGEFRRRIFFQLRLNLIVRSHCAQLGTHAVGKTSATLGFVVIGKNSQAIAGSNLVSET